MNALSEHTINHNLGRNCKLDYSIKQNQYHNQIWYFPFSLQVLVLKHFETGAFPHNEPKANGID
jgi:hypothetical protein